MAKKQSRKEDKGQAVMWLVDENGRRTFTVSKAAWDALHEGRDANTDSIAMPAISAMSGVLTTMRAQSSLRQ